MSIATSSQFFSTKSFARPKRSLSAALPPHFFAASFIRAAFSLAASSNEFNSRRSISSDHQGTNGEPRRVNKPFSIISSTPITSLSLVASYRTLNGTLRSVYGTF